jgi:uncharacterized phage protein gp47/JayE
MPAEGDILYMSREEILAEFHELMRQLIPDVYLGPDGNLNLFFEVLAGVTESVFQALQINSENMFVMTANEGALENHGIQYGVTRKQGTPSTGTLRFAGEGGTVIPINTEVAHDPGSGEEPLYFLTTETDTIPNPGVPTAPTLADGGVGVMIAGSYEYGISFVTAEGETELGTISAPIVQVINKKVNLTAIPVGGPGTTRRRIYRQRDLGGFKFVAEIADNATVIYTDNIAEGGLGAAPLVTSTAERVSMTAASEDSGEIYNVLANTITTLTNVPEGVSEVTNVASFTGGTEREATEDFRQRLLNEIRAPQVGAVADIKSWAESVEGVEDATVYENDNLGVATNGHVTVRISGPNGTVPSAGVQADVLAELDSHDLANVTFHVGTFTPTVTAVTVDVTLDTGYTLADVTPSVQLVSAEYINGLGVGETWRHTGAEAAVWGLPGIIDVTITSPASNQATGATSKRTPGVITVT